MIQANYTTTSAYVVVVGANSGIGLALIKQLLELKATVFGIDIQKESKSPSLENYQYFEANPLDKNSLLQVVEKIGKQTSEINGLVNLSGTISQSRME